MARKYEYTSVDQLPAGALSVREYCNQQGWNNVQNFYNKYRDGKLSGLEIVVYCGLNFIVKKN